MRRSQAACAPENKENVYRASKCMCPGNPAKQENARKSDRFPLGNLQDSNGQKQYLTVDYGIKKNVPARSKSLGQSRDLSPKHLPAYAESTRITHAPPLKQPLTQLLPTVTVRPVQKEEYQKLLSQASQVCVSQAVPVRVRSKSCRCPGNPAATTKITEKEHSQRVCCGKNNDDVFLQPTSARAKNSHLPTPNHVKISSTSTPYPLQPNQRSSSQSRSAENFVRGQSAERTPNSQTSKNCVSSIHIQGSLSARIIPKKEQITQDGESSVPWITTNSPSTRQKSNATSSSSERYSQNSVASANQRKSACSSRTSNICEQNSQQTYKLSQNSVASMKNQGCCSTRSVPIPKASSHKYYETLPSQNFVTLSQDTLKTTFGSLSRDLESITSGLSKVQVSRDSMIFTDEEKTFVDGEQFFKDLERGKKLAINTIQVCSPLSIDLPLRTSNSSSDQNDNKTLRQPAIKSTLRRRSSIKKQIYYPLLYSPDYLEDIIEYSYKHINRFLLKNEWIEVYVNKNARTLTINWLIQVTESVLPHVVDPVYYMTVRIFDFTIVRLRLRNGQYQLAAVVAFWLSLKYLDNSVILKIPKIYALCKGKYSKEEILSMERTILKSVNFCLNISDPLDFLYNYLKSSNLEDNELLKFGCKFVMECATLFENYPLVKAPFMAASALYCAYRILLNSKDVYVNFSGLERKSIEKYADKVLKVNVQYTIMEKYEPVNKYLSPEKLSVAKYFFKI